METEGCTGQPLEGPSSDKASLQQKWVCLEGSPMVTSFSLGSGQSFQDSPKEQQVAEAIFFFALLTFPVCPQQTCVTYYFAIKGRRRRLGSTH